MEIKFRAWDGQKMLHDVIVVNETYVITHMQGLPPSARVLYNSVKGIHQFTGLKDTNGKDIYDGDILEHLPKFETKFVVKRLAAGFYACPLGEEHGESFASLFAGYNRELKQCNSLEIIGNVYENPKLLKK